MTPPSFNHFLFNKKQEGAVAAQVHIINIINFSSQKEEFTDNICPIYMCMVVDAKIQTVNSKIQLKAEKKHIFT